MQIETRKLTDLVPYPRNPREISKEAYQDLKGKIKRGNYPLTTGKYLV